LEGRKRICLVGDNYFEKRAVNEFHRVFPDYEIEFKPVYTTKGLSLVIRLGHEALSFLTHPFLIGVEKGNEEEIYKRDWLVDKALAPIRTLDGKLLKLSKI